MRRLTTHVLDTARGVPAEGLRIELYRLDSDGGRVKIVDTVTNDDGRVDVPLLEGAAFKHGEYELVFHAGGYFDASGQKTSAPKFLDVIPLRFGISSDGHYHVPLLVSPFAYSTYRGS